MPPLHLQRPASRIRPLSAVAPARGLDVEIYDEISEKSCPVSVLAHLLPTGPISVRDFFRHVFSDLRPMGEVCYPAGVAIVDACAGRCVLGSEENWNAPKNTCHPGFVENCHLSKFLLSEGTEIRDQRATYSTAQRV